MSSQLELFKVYTEEQELQFKKEIERLNKFYTKCAEVVDIKYKFLTSNGFVEGVDFIFSNKWEKREHEVTIGYHYNNSTESRKELINTFIGFCQLKKWVCDFSTKEPKISIFNFDIEDNKIVSYEMLGTIRAYKPSTILKRISESKDKVEKIYSNYLKAQDVKKYTLNKYKDLYPNATVTLEREWSKYSNDTIEVVKILFTSGSYVNLRINSQKDSESFYSKFDKVVDSMEKEDLLNYFNNQKQ